VPLIGLVVLLLPGVRGMAFPAVGLGLAAPALARLSATVEAAGARPEGR